MSAILEEGEFYEPCERCRETGFELDGSSICPRCNGAGYIKHACDDDEHFDGGSPPESDLYLA